MGGGLVRLRGECSVGCDGLNLSDGGGVDVCEGGAWRRLWERLGCV